MHLYKIFFSTCRYIALTSIVKVRTVQKWLGTNKFVCTKVTQEVNFQNIFGAFVHPRNSSCAPILWFFCGVRWRHSRPPNSELHVFINFKISNRFGRNFWLLLEELMYLQCTKRFAVLSAGDTTRITNLR